MNFRIKDENDRNSQKREKISYITRLIKDIKPYVQKDTIHCGDYSSIVCLRCDRCWGNSTKSNDK
jgi:hypothetical protein